jgi:hypothetical protein
LSRARFWVVVLALVGPPLQAHDVRPALLDLTQESTGRVRVRLAVPLVGGMAPSLRPRFSGSWREVEPARVARQDDVVTTETVFDPGGSPAGRTIAIDGLPESLSDVLVQVSLLDGTRLARILRPDAPFFTIPAGERRLAGGYFRLGIEHILGGVDHLLFVFGLLVLAGRRFLRIFQTITAFTVAHSLTLGLAALGAIQVPTAPLHAAIALSILFVGVEIAHRRQGRTSVTIERPWVAAFAFGLLHGLSFASGLQALGLTTRDLALAALLFNLGVEAGQLAFVLLCLAVARALRELETPWPRWAEALPGLLVGTLGAYWTIAQAAVLVAGSRP